MADGQQRRERQRQWHDRLQRGGESEYDAAERDDHGRRADLYGDAGGGGLQHDDLTDGELADGGGWFRDGGGDGERGVVRVDGRQQRGVDHYYGRCERHRERQRVAQRGRQCADQQPDRDDDDCRADDDGDGGGAVHVCDLADGRVARAGGVDEHDCGDGAGGMCAWTTSESATWISITGGASGSGNGTVTYSVTANPTITARNVTMTIAGQSFDVTQAGQPCTYTLTPAGGVGSGDGIDRLGGGPRSADARGRRPHQRRG